MNITVAATQMACTWDLDKNIENIENGLDVFETVDESTGEVVSYQFDFPLSYIKAMARWKAKSHLNQDLSESEIKVLEISGNWVVEWLPQTTNCLMDSTGLFTLLPKMLLAL